MSEKDQNLESRLYKLTAKIEVNPEDAGLYFERAEIYAQQNQLAKAINDYDLVLDLDPENKQASTKKEMIQTILRYNNTDIYASPNTDMDPWLE